MNSGGEHLQAVVDSGADLDAGTGAGWRGPLFIVGMPRSGTKLLRGLLCQHERIRILPAETEFLPALATWIDRHGTPQHAVAFSNLYLALHSAPYFAYRKARGPPFDWRQWRARCAGRFDLDGLFEGFVRYELELDRSSDVIWADKSPAYIRHLPLLLDGFPCARIIHIVRDVRDYCASTRRTWGKDVRRAADRWATDVMCAHRQCVTTPSRCVELRYEDLLQDPGGQMYRLCRFLGVAYSRSLTQLQRPVEPCGATAARVGIARDNFNTYGRYLAPGEILAIESLAWETMQALGYEPRVARCQQRLRTPQRQLLQLKDGLQLLSADARHKGWAGALRFHASHLRMLAKR
jgi:hypothetical protein